MWIPDAFNGASLLLAVGPAKYPSGDAYKLVRRVLRRDRAAPSGGFVATDVATCCRLPSIEAR
ncbi:MAG: hypothetical protein ACRDWT_10575 [Jatrophihabitantaceae bacterium]